MQEGVSGTVRDRDESSAVCERVSFGIVDPMKVRTTGEAIVKWGSESKIQSKGLPACSSHKEVSAFGVSRGSVNQLF